MSAIGKRQLLLFWHARFYVCLVALVSLEVSLDFPASDIGYMAGPISGTPGNLVPMHAERLEQNVRPGLARPGVLVVALDEGLRGARSVHKHREIKRDAREPWQVAIVDGCGRIPPIERGDVLPVKAEFKEQLYQECGGFIGPWSAGNAQVGERLPSPTVYAVQSKVRVDRQGAGLALLSAHRAALALKSMT